MKDCGKNKDTTVRWIFFFFESSILCTFDALTYLFENELLLVSLYV